jgi:hypothetical protein
MIETGSILLHLKSVSPMQRSNEAHIVRSVTSVEKP